MKIQRKLLLSYIMIVVLFASIGAVITVNTLKMNQLQTDANDVVQIGNYATAYQQGMDLKKYGFLEANVDFSASTTDTAAAVQITDAAERYLMATIPKDSDLYNKFMACYNINHNVIDASVNQIAEVLQNPSDASTNQILYLGQVIANGYQDISANMTAFHVAVLENVQTSAKESQDYANFSLALSAIGISTIAIISIVMALVIGRRITNPLKKLTDIAGKVSLGDLNHEVKFGSKDEIGELGDAFQRMINAFKMTNAMCEEEEKH
jgi:nitrogen fixation/metabolism regulation signal transduction histidine kinase